MDQFDQSHFNDSWYFDEENNENEEESECEEDVIY